MPPTRVVLITGCSSGIGAATALRLHRAGHLVYASARRVDELAGLAAAGIATLHLDVTDEASMQAVVKRIAEERGRIDALVNNAGYGVIGALEEVPPAAVRSQFETNVFGAVRLIQLVLPGMRAAGWGRIVNLSSVLGQVAVPGSAVYGASKYALEGVSDALRVEVARFGVHVSLIEPGPVRTAFAARATAELPGDSAAYEDFRDRLADWFAAVYGPARPNPLGRFTVDSEAVAAAVDRAIRARRPRARYPVGLPARGLSLLRRMLPGRLLDGFVRAQFPAP
ncbi:SDR family NAD(P)-dependent oxidoreductase [Micromonospora sp. SL1-18]|uniref:SDR family NAD(P)-dependent oxidoreductase n=1 Tax=Micromonospora sp. SL1-18 TaxID=3399128 RepID=UPI003A4DAFCE